MKNSELLKQAKALIADPKNWIQSGSYAAKRDGHSVPTDHDEACCFCAMGAEMHACHVNKCEDKSAIALDLYMYRACQDLYGTRNVVNINDDRHTKHLQIMALYDRAIAAAERDELMQVANV